MSEGLTTFRRMKVQIDLVDGRQVVATLMPGDVVACERQYSTSASQIDADPHIEHVMYMAWVASRRAGYGADFETFVAEVANVEMMQGGTEDPTPPVP